MSLNILPAVSIGLPPLHKNQQKIKNDKHRFRVVDAGRRFGKSMIALAECIERAVNLGQKVWWLSPSYGISDSQWRNTKMVLGADIDDIVSYKSEQQRRMEFYYDDGRRGELSFKSADRPNNLRGEGLDFVVVDEAAFVHPDIWETVLRPSLVDRQGAALFISTPNGTNWFFRLYQRGLSEGDEWYKVGESDPDWKSFRFTSYDNLAINNVKQEVDAAKRDMSDLRFRQEHLAEFLTDTGSLFRGVSKMATLPIMDYAIKGHLYSAGIDWGRKYDATVITVVDITTGQQVYIDRFTQTGWAIQRGRVMSMIDKFHPVKIYAEANAAGQPIIEQLETEGVKNIIAFYTGSNTKAPLIEALALAIERGNLGLITEDEPLGAIQANELKAYTMWQTRNNNWQYGAPPGFMDDTVVALALAYQGVVNKPATMTPSFNPFYGSPKGKPKPPQRRSFFERRVFGRLR